MTAIGLFLASSMMMVIFDQEREPRFEDYFVQYSCEDTPVEYFTKATLKYSGYDYYAALYK